MIQLCDSNTRNEFQKIQKAYLNLKENTVSHVQEGENPGVKIILECLKLSPAQQSYLKKELLNMSVRSDATPNDILELVVSTSKKNI